MNRTSIFLSSAGRRICLLKAFREAAHRRNWQLIAGDHDPLAPALYFADEAVALPCVNSPDYIPALLAQVDKNGVRLIVPTIDTELLVLAKHIEAFAKHDCVVLVSSPELVRIARDKWLTVQTFSSAGYATARSWLPSEIDGDHLPNELFVKPRDGSASQNAFAVKRDALAEILSYVPNPIVQERLEGEEITIDALLDLSGRPIHFVPRTRIRTMSGESIQGVTLSDLELREWVTGILELACRWGGRGPLTLQAFLTGSGPVLSEINPRFGGGFPLTLAAGGNYPEWILQDLENKPVSPCFGTYRQGLYMTRYYAEHFTEFPLW